MTTVDTILCYIALLIVIPLMWMSLGTAIHIALFDVDNVDNPTRKQFIISSIVLGPIYVIYNIVFYGKKWIHDWYYR